MTAAEIRELVGKSPSILEIGSWEGDTTEQFLTQMPGARIVCFEPDGRPLRRLQTRFANDPRVTIFPYAIGNESGCITWYASHGNIRSSCCRGDWSLSGSIRCPTHHLLRSPGISFSEEAVVCVQLDELYGELPSFDFAWIDCQGAQHDVIAGGRNTLDRIGYIYIECHKIPEYDGEPNFQELSALLPKHEPIARYAENYLYRTTDA